MIFLMLLMLELTIIFSKILKIKIIPIKGKKIIQISNSVLIWINKYLDA